MNLVRNPTHIGVLEKETNSDSGPKVESNDALSPPVTRQKIGVILDGAVAQG